MEFSYEEMLEHCLDLPVQKVTPWEVKTITRREMLKEVIDNLNISCSYEKLSQVEKLYVLEMKTKELEREVTKTKSIDL